LLGVDADKYDVLAKECGSFYVSLSLLQRDVNVKWECLVVYGPAHHDASEMFLRDLDTKLCRTDLPILLAGDFNLIRSPADKNNDNIDVPLMSLFNDLLLTTN
jgi:hypothetical protein